MGLGKIQDFSGPLSIHELEIELEDEFRWEEKDFMELQFKEIQHRRTAEGISLVQHKFCEKKLFQCCKLLNFVRLHLEDLGVLEHSEKLSVLPLWSIKYITKININSTSNTGTLKGVLLSNLNSAQPGELLQNWCLHSAIVFGLCNSSVDNAWLFDASLVQLLAGLGPFAGSACSFKENIHIKWLWLPTVLRTNRLCVWTKHSTASLILHVCTSKCGHEMKHQRCLGTYCNR